MEKINTLDAQAQFPRIIPLHVISRQLCYLMQGQKNRADLICKIKYRSNTADTEIKTFADRESLREMKIRYLI